MPFKDNKKSYIDTLFSISTLLKMWYTEIQEKDVDKNYMLRRLNQWIEQLESLRNEIIVVDDNSKDITSELIENYKDVKLIKHEINKG